MAREILIVTPLQEEYDDLYQSLTTLGLPAVDYLEIRGATDTANHEAPVVFYVNLKIVMRNIALLLHKWLGK
jgi:hypothetical protein